MLRVASGFWLFAALLVLHGAASPVDRASFGQLDSIFNRMAPLSAEEPTNQPTIQPRGPASTAFSELRTLVAKEDMATNRGAPSALTAGPPAILSLVLGDGLRPVSEALTPPAVPRVFDARAPPSLT